MWKVGRLDQPCLVKSAESSIVRRVVKPSQPLSVSRLNRTPVSSATKQGRALDIEHQQEKRAVDVLEPLKPVMHAHDQVRARSGRMWTVG